MGFVVSHPFAKLQEAGSSTPLRFAQNDIKDGARRESWVSGTAAVIQVAISPAWGRKPRQVDVGRRRPE